MKRILILNGAGKKNGNTAALIKAFVVQPFLTAWLEEPRHGARHREDGGSRDAWSKYQLRRNKMKMKPSFDLMVSFSFFP